MDTYKSGSMSTQDTELSKVVTGNERARNGYASWLRIITIKSALARMDSKITLPKVSEPKVDAKTSPAKVNEISPAKLSNGQHPTPPNGAMLASSASIIEPKTRRSMVSRTEILIAANEMTPKAPAKEVSPKRKPAPHLNRLVNPNDDITESDSKQPNQNSTLEYRSLHSRLVSLPSLHASSSNVKLDFQQRLSDFEHLNLPLSTPENGAFDEKRLISMTIEQYTSFFQELGLRELRDHHTKLFKLVRQYQTLFSIASSISVEIQSGEALSRIVEGSYEVLEVEHVALFLISHKTQSLQLCVSRTTSPVMLPLNKGIIGYVAKHGQSAIVQDVEKDERIDPAVDFVLGNKPTRNILCVPILDPSNVPVAILHCTNKSTNFSDSDRMSLELIATIAGHTLHKLELYEVAMLAGRKASAMLEVVRAIATECNDLNVMIHRIIDVAKSALNCDRVSLFLCHKVKKELVCCFSYDPLLQRTVIPYGVGIAGHVAITGKILRIDDCYEDERFNSKIDLKMDYKTVSALCAPVVTHDNDMVAVIQAINKLKVKPTEAQPHRSNIIPFQEEDIQMLTAFCEEIASSLRRSALETAYHQVLQGVNHMKRRDSVTLVVSSLLTVHSQASDHSTVLKRHWYVYAFRAIGRFMRRLKQKRGDQIWTGRPRTSSLLVKGTLHCKWNSEQFAFDDFSFNIFTCGYDQLNYLCVQAFAEIGLFETFSVPEAIGIAFVNRVQSGYMDNPYHSWWHGVDVFQRCFALLNRTQLLHFLQPIHVFALLISALTHDIGHPGTDNGFESATLSPLALLYNDISVLEQHHAAETFRILSEAKCNVLGGLCKTAYQSIRKLIVDAILQTDMKSHFDLVHALEDANLRQQKQTLIFNMEDALHVKQLLGSILHAADIGAQAYPFDVAWEWSRRLVEEFALLSMKERENGLPVAAFREHLESDNAIATLQLNFINYIVSPLWTLVMEIFPGAKVLKSNLDCNRLYFQQGVAEDAALKRQPNTSESGRRATTQLTLVPKRLKFVKSQTQNLTDVLCEDLAETLAKLKGSPKATEKPKE